ncbi:MAG: aldo/keto reductase family protein [Planctomycetota bacterium]
MQYRNLGASGLRVSAVSLGGWLTFGGTVDDATTATIVARAVDLGVNFIDLADAYARGGAEEAVGRAIRGMRRSDLVLSSKAFWPMGDGPNDRGLSRKHLFESVDASLKRLGTDYLDLYFCHRADPETPLHETAEAMSDLVRMGKVLYWGTSVWPAELLDRTHDVCERRALRAPIVEQPEYSLLQRGIEASVLPFARRSGTGVVVWSPLAGGLLTSKYDRGVPEASRGATSSWLDEHLNERTLERLRAFSEMARERGVRPAQLALAWVLAQDGISAVITGATRPEQIEENVAAVGVELDSETLERLDALFPAGGAADAASR